MVTADGRQLLAIIWGILEGAGIQVPWRARWIDWTQEHQRVGQAKRRLAVKAWTPRMEVS